MIMGKYSLLFFIVCFLFFIPGFSSAQVKITLDSCIARALESNYSIKIIRNQQRQAENNLNYGPFLPTIGIDAAQKQSITDSKVVSDGEDRRADNSRSDALSAGVSLNWRLFDGMEMFMTHNRYAEMLAIACKNRTARSFSAGKNTSTRRVPNRRTNPKTKRLPSVAATRQTRVPQTAPKA